MNEERDGKAAKSNLRSQWRLRLKAIRNLPPVLRIVWDSGRWIVVGCLAIRILIAIIPIAMLAVARVIIDGVSTVSRGNPVPERFWWWVVLECAIAFAGSLLGRAVGYLDSLLADRFSRCLSVRVMKHASRLDLASYEDPEFHDRLERARAQATDRVRMVRAIGETIQQAVCAVGLCAGLIWFSPWLLVVLVVCTTPAFIGESHYAFLGYSLSFQQTTLRRELDYLRVLGASKDSAKELKLFGLAEYLNGRFERLSDTLYHQNAKLARKRLWGGGLLALLSTAGYYASYVWVVRQAVAGEITVGTMTFLAGAITGASSNLQALFLTFSSIADEALFLTELIAFFEQKPRLDTNSKRPPPHPIVDGFRFENVSFHYPANSRMVLDGLSFRLAPGERIALVGANGQGKTTIVKLMARLYDPTGGRILLDGVDLREYDVDGLTRQIAVIFQDFIRYDMTVRENIGIGQVEYLSGSDHSEQIQRAAEKSLAAPVIERLPARFDQMLGRRFDQGVDLSGGEWQKIALARAYLRDAQVLILDEPTASLDAKSELEVFERLADLSEGRMALLISHRFSTVRMADRILVLEDGKIVEEGSHEELMELEGRYASMFTMQASSYL
ncbi:MAG TPA: ABC transporter ATP-binding protein [Bryobacteraceae bacterium]|nr:ABC transporter ATP-binding protein [Bryobacteraceae bacterium]